MNPLRHDRSWDQKDVVELRQQWAARTPVKAIARMLERTPAGVYSKACALKLPRRMANRRASVWIRLSQSDVNTLRKLAGPRPISGFMRDRVVTPFLRSMRDAMPDL